MARSFVTNKFLGYGTITIDYPFTLVAWLYLNTQGDYVIMSIGDSAGSYYLSLRTDAGRLQAAAFDGSTTFSINSTALTTGVWYHGAAVFASASSKTVYVNGSGSTPNTTSVAVPLNRTSIGVSADSSPFGYLNGGVAETAIYNKALSADEILQLAKKYSPLMVARSNLIHYWPLVRGV